MGYVTEAQKPTRQELFLRQGGRLDQINGDKGISRQLFGIAKAKRELSVRYCWDLKRHFPRSRFIRHLSGDE
jgi:hypothetical protein